MPSDRAEADAVQHNHLTREIRPQGECPKCDEYYEPDTGEWLTREQFKERYVF